MFHIRRTTEIKSRQEWWPDILLPMVLLTKSNRIHVLGLVQRVVLSKTAGGGRGCDDWEYGNDVEDEGCHSIIEDT